MLTIINTKHNVINSKHTVINVKHTVNNTELTVINTYDTVLQNSKITALIKCQANLFKHIMVHILVFVAVSSPLACLIPHCSHCGFKYPSSVLGTLE